MNVQEFIDAIKIAVVDGSIESIESNLIKPPGKKPAEKLIETSMWFNELNNEDKAVVLQIVKEAVETSVFGFLCVLDGVRPIEDESTKGKFELFYERLGSRQLLNKPDGEYLHDLFNKMQ